MRDRGTPERLSVADLTVLVNGSAAAVRGDRSPPNTASGASRLGSGFSSPSGAADSAADADDTMFGTPSTSSSSSWMFFDSPHRVVVIATVVSGALFVLVLIGGAVGIGVAVCRCRRRRRRKLADLRHDEWLRQQASTACSDAGCSCAERRSNRSGRGSALMNHRGNQLQLDDSGSLVGSSSMAASSLRGCGGVGGRMTIGAPTATTMMQSSTCDHRGPWRAVGACDVTSGTDRDDDDELSDCEDVPLSAGLMMGTSSSSSGSHRRHHHHHVAGCRHDVEHSQVS